jgi:hypothetical protein
MDEQMALPEPTLMTVPEVRDRLYAMADAYRLPELRHLADQLHRRKPARPKARAQSPTMTPALVEAIRLYADIHPGMSEHRIGIVFGVNQGRVSEALSGFRA